MHVQMYNAHLLYIIHALHIHTYIHTYAAALRVPARYMRTALDIQVLYPPAVARNLLKTAIRHQV